MGGFYNLAEAAAVVQLKVLEKCRRLPWKNLSEHTGFSKAGKVFWQPMAIKGNVSQDRGERAIQPSGMSLMETVLVLASGANLSAMMTSVGRMNSTPWHDRVTSVDGVDFMQCDESIPQEPVVGRILTAPV